MASSSSLETRRFPPPKDESRPTRRKTILEFLWGVGGESEEELEEEYQESIEVRMVT